MNLILSMNALGFYSIALAGVLIHIAVKWARNELPVSVPDYLFRSNKKATVLMLMTAIGSTAAVLLSGTISNLGDGAHVLAAWGIGYAADSAINKGQSA